MAESNDSSPGGATVCTLRRLRRAPEEEGDVRSRRGSGPPLLLLHRSPEPHLAWALVAGELARKFTVMAPGHGDSSKPAAVPTRATASESAQDCIALMRHFRFDRCDAVGHDRGGRVAYMMALDSPDVVGHFTLLEAIPTGGSAAAPMPASPSATGEGAFLAHRHPIPERLIEQAPEFLFLDAEFGGAIRGFPTGCARDPAVMEAMCEDYRAGATCDRQRDGEDRVARRRTTCPTQVLWADSGAPGAWHGTLAIWRGLGRRLRPGRWTAGTS